MSKLKLGLLSILVAQFIMCSFAEDKVNYAETERKFLKTRQVADAIGGIPATIGTTAQTMTLPRTSLAVTLINDHASNSVFINVNGGTALNYDNNGATTSENSNEIDLNTDISSLGIVVGDYLFLDEGDGNDGIYVIIRIISGTNKVHVDRNLSVAHSADQDYVLKSPEVKAGEAQTFPIGTKSISILGSAASTTYRLIVDYQRGS